MAARRVTSMRLVGRAPELTELEGAVADAAAGRPRLVFVAGESGVGKTRVLSELARRAKRAHDARILSGDCVELGEGELPYAPLVSALRALARARDPVLETLAPAVLDDLSTLLPSLTSQPSRPGTADAAQSRVFEALLELIDALGREDGPLLLVIEDLHWADRSTRAFLAFLAASLCDERVLVVASYRPDELHRRHPLRPLLAELERDHRARRIELAPLSEVELAEQLSDILGASADTGLVARLFARSEGNPLFTEELLAAGLDGRGGPSPTLRDALMVRIERLGPDAQDLLRTLAVGQRLDHTLLAAATTVDARDLLEALRDAVASHILVVDDDGRYAFRHALLREVVHDDLLPGEHAELHLALAHALERSVPDGAHRLASLAHHYQAAGDQPSALASSVRAATAAEDVRAHGEAAALLERALELWDRVPDAEALTGTDRLDLLLRAASAHQHDADTQRQESMLRTALDLVPEDDTLRRAAVLGRLHGALWALNRQDEAMDVLDHALALVEGAPAAACAPLLAERSARYMLQARNAEAEAIGRLALQAAEQAGNHSAASSALCTIGITLMAQGDPTAGIDSLRRALAIADEHDLRASLLRAYVNLADCLHLSGRSREALQTAREGTAAAGRDVRQREWLVLAVSEYAFDAGDWDEAERRLPPPDPRRVGTVLLNELLRRAELALGRGEDADARAILAEAAPLNEASTEPQFLGVYGSLTAELERRAGDLDAARAAVAEGLDRIEFCSDDVVRVVRISVVGAVIEAESAVQARDRGDLEEAAAATERSRVFLERVQASAAQGDRPVEHAALLFALAAHARAAGADDPARWLAAADAFGALERPYVAAQASWHAAEAYAAADDRDAACVACAGARRAAQALGARWLVRELDGLAARARLRIPEPGAAGADPVAADHAPAASPAEDDPFGLTPRERQVLGLVAEGATNREIGASLFMAEKTASVHVSRILAKLDVRSRTQAAAVAHRLGLT